MRRRGDTLDVFYSRIGDAPERILHSTVDCSRPWLEWEATDPVEPSRTGAVSERVCQLRDPGVYREDGSTYLLYSVAGERGIAVTEVID